MADKLQLLTGRSSPRLHSEILQRFGVSVKLFQLVERVHIKSKENAAEQQYYRQIPALQTHQSSSFTSGTNTGNGSTNQSRPRNVFFFFFYEFTTVAYGSPTSSKIK